MTADELQKMYVEKIRKSLDNPKRTNALKLSDVTNHIYFYEKALSDLGLFKLEDVLR